MSRIGKKPVPLAAGVKVAVSGRQITVEKGNDRLSFTHRREVSVKVDDQAKQVVVSRADDSRTARAMHGLTRAMINNMIIGVSEGYSKELEINGVGWTAKQEGMKIALNLGFADTRYVAVPAGIKVDIKGNRIKISGVDKQMVGQLAAQIRSQRKPEPYNGKGIKYSDEVIVRKQGKAFASG